MDYGLIKLLSDKEKEIKSQIIEEIEGFEEERDGVFLENVVINGDSDPIKIVCAHYIDELENGAEEFLMEIKFKCCYSKTIMQPLKVISNEVSEYTATVEAGFTFNFDLWNEECWLSSSGLGFNDFN